MKKEELRDFVSWSQETKMADAIIVALTASLVREYLSRKGLKSTLQTLDKELPRTEESISNRAQLAKEMHIEKLMKKNKELPEPFRTMLEVIVRFMRERDIQNSTSSHVGTERSNQRPNSARYIFFKFIIQLFSFENRV